MFFRDDPFDLNEEFEEIPNALLDDSLWREVFAVRVQYPEHITLLEGRGIVAAMRHKLRSTSEFGMRHLRLNDNMGAVLMCSKGRSGVFCMLKVCRRLCALLLASDSKRAQHSWQAIKALGVAKERPCYWQSRSRAVQKGDWQQVLSQTGQPMGLRRSFVQWRGPQQDTAGEGEAEGRKSGCKNGSATISRANHIGALGHLRAGGFGLCPEVSGTLWKSTSCPWEGWWGSTRPAACFSTTSSSKASSCARAQHKVLGSNPGRIPRLRPQEPLGEDEEGIARMVKGRSSEDKTSHTLEPHCRHGDEVGGEKEVSSGIGNPDNVHSLPQTKRVPGPDEGRPGATNASSEIFSLHLHPSSRQEVSKVGLSDESLLLDSVVVPWLGEVLTNLTSSGPFLFYLSYTDLVMSWKQALVDMQLQPYHAVLYQLRRSGPRHDRCFQLRSLAEIKTRGQWTSDSSLEAHGRISQEFHALPEAIQRLVLKLEKLLAKMGPKSFVSMKH